MSSIKTTYPVSGMTCAACAHSVESMLMSQAGVEQAAVNLANNSVSVVYDESTTNFGKMKVALEQIGYNISKSKSEGEELKLQGEQVLKKKLWVAIIFTIPVFVLSMFFMDSFAGQNYLLLALTTPIVFYSGNQFYLNAWKKLQHGSSNMDTLIAIGTGAAFLFSLINTLFPTWLASKGMHPHVYYESAAVIISLILLGNYLEERAKGRTGAAIEKLMGLQVKQALILKDGQEHMVDLSEVKVGDLIVIKPGALIPVDGKVMEGESYVEESMLTGEPGAVIKRMDDSLTGGTINQNGRLVMEAQKVGEETMLARIIQMVADAQGSKAPIQKLADRISAIFVPIVLVIALLSFGFWMIFGPDPALTNAFVVLVTVLIIACPCALGLATPTAIMVGIGRGADQGILIKNAEMLEKTKNLDVLIVDKTGTITEGNPSVQAVLCEQTEEQKNSLFSAIKSLENQSEHPLAKAIDRHFNEVELKEVRYFNSITGQGIKGEVGGVTYFIGKPDWLKNLKVSASLKEQSQALINEGQTVIAVANSKEVVAFIGIKDAVKAGAKQSISQLTEMGISVVMLSGDNPEAVAKVAQEVGIKTYQGSLMPADKRGYIIKQQEEGKKVGMAGDGINDAPALAQADVGLAMGTGSDVAIETAGIVLLKGDISKIATAISLSTKTVKTIRQNLFWAFFYNVAAIPVAAGALYPAFGFLLNPMIAGAAMAFSSVSVVLNSLRLKKA